MPSNKVFSELLKKSFDISNGVSRSDDKRSGYNRFDKIDKLTALIQDMPKKSTSKRVSTAINSYRGKNKSIRAAVKLSQYSDPFEKVVVEKPSVKKIVKKTYSNIDYNQEQKQLRTKQNAKLVIGMFLLGTSLILLAAVGMLS